MIIRNFVKNLKREDKVYLGYEKFSKLEKVPNLVLLDVSKRDFLKFLLEDVADLALEKVIDLTKPNEETLVFYSTEKKKGRKYDKEFSNKKYLVKVQRSKEYKETYLFIVKLQNKK